MDLNPIYFPQTTNRESWAQVLKMTDQDTGELIDLSGLTTMVCEVRCVADGQRYGDGYRESYDYGIYNDVGPRITLGLNSGITVIDTGTIQLSITRDQMRSLQPGTYSIALTVGDADDTRQVFLGRLPVLYGGVS